MQFIFCFFNLGINEADSYLFFPCIFFFKPLCL
uniref:Uncharacterized protein n=1 Tax=Rhizophora mucronata TaxID=61149 RepID=A0A2P2LX74_RHIMU